MQARSRKNDLRWSARASLDSLSLASIPFSFISPNKSRLVDHPTGIPMHRINARRSHYYGRVLLLLLLQTAVRDTIRSSTQSVPDSPLAYIWSSESGTFPSFNGTTRNRVRAHNGRRFEFAFEFWGNEGRGGARVDRL